MDHLDDEDIGIIWARHYHKRAEHASSMSLCVTLAMIVKQRAKSVDQYSDWPAKLEHALATANIPKEQFETVENSQPLSSPSDSSLRSPAITILSSVPRISSIPIPPHYLTAPSSSFSLLGFFL